MNRSRKRRAERTPGDPLGQRGLPETRYGLDFLAQDLCRRLQAAGSTGIRGRQLVAELALQDTRALRLLVAYARVHKHVHQIVGVPGSRYFWGDCFEKGLYKQAIADCQRRGRCYFFIAALHGRQGTAMAAAQMVFDWFEQQVPPEARRSDDLAALVAAEGVGVADVLDAIITRLAATAEGKKALADVGQRHAQVLLPAEVLARLATKLADLREEVLGMAKRTA